MHIKEGLEQVKNQLIIEVVAKEYKFLSSALQEMKEQVFVGY